MEHKRRKLKKGIIAKIIMIICIGGMIYSTITIVKWKKNVNDNNKISNKIAKHIKKIDDDYKIDFKKLKKQNRDVIAYISVRDTNINYVVVKGKNNSYYLNHNFDKKANAAGWIFADYRNKFNGKDKNIILYGHNMQDGSMFGSLKDTLTKEWRNIKKNQQINLVTERGSYIYQVFSTYTIEPEDYYITTDFANDANYKKFLDKLKSRSIYNYDVKLDENDHILTLSTCNEDGKKRVVLHAKKSK